MTRVPSVFLGLSVLVAQATPPKPPAPSTLSVRHAILVAEDSRADQASLKPVLDALKHPDPAIQRIAVRALGRLERSENAPAVTPLLSAADPDVRGEAANALAQMTLTDPRPVADLLLKRLAGEQHPGAQGDLAAAVGRLPYAVPSDFATIEAALIQAAGRGSDPALQVGVARGFDALFRRMLRVKRQQKLPDLKPTGPAVEWLKRTVAGVGAELPRSEPRVRRLALGALISAAAVDAELARTALADADAEVRRLSMAAVNSADQPIGQKERTDLAAAGLKDKDAPVRYDALSAYARQLPGLTCAPVFRALDDLDDRVAMLAIDALGSGCPEKQRVLDELETIIAELTARRGADWHRPARAIVSLARLDAKRAAPRLPTFARNHVWQMRMYAGRAAAAVKDTNLLERLAIDEHDNVRHEAVRLLTTVNGHASDRLYLAALRSRDPQLAIAASQALAGTPQPAAAVPALLQALTRLTAERKDTSRDARMAILERLQEVGSAAQADALRPYLSDFDPRIAARASAVLSKWTGTAVAAVTTTLQLVAPPSLDELAALPTRARLTMRAGGAMELRLFGDEAPATVARFARLARAGYYNGLTFHRVVPNFVIQGGSPGANEYVGDARFMRDELGRRTHARGTVGISTRGRDTGDAQIFVNLVDNPRLDHEYTVFAEIARGFEILDRILEGDAIERIEILP